MKNDHRDKLPLPEVAEEKEFELALAPEPKEDKVSYPYGREAMGFKPFEWR